MRGLFRRLFGIFMVLVTASMIAQDADIDPKLKELVAEVKIGTAVTKWPKDVEKIVDEERKKILAKVGKSELFNTSAGQCYITSLEPELVQEVRDALLLLDLPDFIEKMPILGMKPVKREDIGVSTCCCTVSNKDLPAIPCAMLLNPEVFFSKTYVFTAEKLFLLLREIGYIKACCSGLRLDRDKELGKVVADTYALVSLAKIFAQYAGKWRIIVGELYLMDNLKPCLSCYELVYYAEKLFADQKKGGSFDVLPYAKKIIADRKNDNYEQKIMQEAKGLLGLTDDDDYEVAQHADKDIQVDPELKKLVAGVKIGTAVKNVPKNLPKCVEKIVDKQRKIILSKVGKPELVDTAVGQYYLTPLESALEEEVRWVLKLIDVPELIEKLPIVGMKLPEGKEKTGAGAMVLNSLGFNNDLRVIPYAISVDEAIIGTKKADFEFFINNELRRLYIFFHEGGHVKAFLSGVFGDRELNEVVAEVYALTVFIRFITKVVPSMLNNRQDLLRTIYFDVAKDRREPFYLSRYELVYHAEKLFDDQRKGGNFDVLPYAKKIIADRKNDDYEQKIMQEAKKLLNLTDDGEQQA